MGRSSSKVMAPRNVELPSHLLSQPPTPSLGLSPNPSGANPAKKPPKKKCVCLSAWLAFLVLLCAGIVILLASVLPIGPENNSRRLVQAGCLEGHLSPSLESKVSLSELIVVVERHDQAEDRFAIRQVIKSSNGNHIWNEAITLHGEADCQLPEDEDRLLLFLDNDQALRFAGMPSTGKLLEVVQSFVGSEPTVAVAGIVGSGGYDSLAGHGNSLEPTDLCEGVECEYGAQCMIKIQPGTEAREAVCSCDSLCSEEEKKSIQVVCGSDHVTYGNLCGLREASCRRENNVTAIGAPGVSCDEAQLCGIPGCDHYAVCARGTDGLFSCLCSDCSNALQDPVCGSDGVEYASECQLQESSCKSGVQITVQNKGRCDSCLTKVCQDHEECIEDAEGRGQCVCQKCPTEDLSQGSNQEVCGSDGITYFSLCHLNQASCAQKTSLYVDHYGPCDMCQNVTCGYDSACVDGLCMCREDERCPESYEPVCASNGKSYLNYCFMELENCLNQLSETFVPLTAVESRVCSEEEERLRKALGVDKSPNCELPGVGGKFCQECLPEFWAYTSFGCKECECNSLGSLSSECHPQTGICRCKAGFSGSQCHVCPDGTLADITGCLSGSTRYKKPIVCGDAECNFGATCASVGSDGQKECLCQIDCRNPLFYREAVCGTDGNTYRSECQLRQYSCRIQKEVSITLFEPCRDAPTSIYGGVLADEEKIPDFSTLGRYCNMDKECQTAHSSCQEGRCLCKEGYQVDPEWKTCQESISTDSPLSNNLCESNPCHGGGTCESHDGTFSCYCPPGRAGHLCQTDLKASGSGMKVASFTGSSLVAMETPNDAVSRLEVELELRTFSREGLVLFGMQGTSAVTDEAGDDFISIAVIEGYVEFRFDLGSGPARLRSNIQLELGQWYTVTARRYHQDGLLEVTPVGSATAMKDRVMGRSGGSLRTLNLGGLTWLGGPKPGDAMPSNMVKSKAGTSKGFLGCLRHIRLRKKPVILVTEGDPAVKMRKGLVDCEDNPCVRAPCGSHGECSVQERGQRGSLSSSGAIISQGFQCKCHSDYTGRRCQRRRNQCHPNPCQNGGQCRLESQGSSWMSIHEQSSSGFSCHCANGFKGRLCEVSLFNDEDKRYRKSPEPHLRQRLSFGLWTNVSHAGLLFSTPVALSADKRGQLRVSTDSEGFLGLSITGAEDPSQVVASLESKRTLAIGSGWIRVGLLLQQDLLTVQMEGGPEGQEKTHWQMHLTGHEELTSWKSFRILQNQPLSFGSGLAGRFCLRHFILRTWRHHRLTKSTPLDICK